MLPSSASPRSFNLKRARFTVPDLTPHPIRSALNIAQPLSHATTLPLRSAIARSNPIRWPTEHSMIATIDLWGAAVLP